MHAVAISRLDEDIVGLFDNRRILHNRPVGPADIA